MKMLRTWASRRGNAIGSVRTARDGFYLSKTNSASENLMPAKIMKVVCFCKSNSIEPRLVELRSAGPLIPTSSRWLAKVKFSFKKDKMLLEPCFHFTIHDSLDFLISPEDS